MAGLSELNTDRIRWRNPTTAVVKKDQVVELPNGVGVAVTDIEPYEDGSLLTDGLLRFFCAGAGTIAEGTTVGYDASTQLVSTSATLKVGVVWEPKDEGAERVWIKLNAQGGSGGGGGSTITLSGTTLPAAEAFDLFVLTADDGALEKGVWASDGTTRTRIAALP